MSVIQPRLIIRLIIIIVILVVVDIIIIDIVHKVHITAMIQIKSSKLG